MPTQEQIDRHNEQRRKRRAAMTPEARKRHDRQKYDAEKARNIAKGLPSYGDKTKVNAKRRRWVARHAERQAWKYREQSFKRRYGITLEQYNEALKKQGGVCATCHEPETTIRHGTLMVLSVDHDHETKRFRGLLCNRCNRTLGLAKDDAVVLFNLAKYLLEFRTPAEIEEVTLH